MTSALILAIQPSTLVSLMTRIFKVYYQNTFGEIWERSAEWCKWHLSLQGPSWALKVLGAQVAKDMKETMDFNFSAVHLILKPMAVIWMKQIKWNWVFMLIFCQIRLSTQYEHKGQLRDYQKFPLENVILVTFLRHEETEPSAYWYLDNDENCWLCYKKINIWGLNKI